MGQKIDSDNNALVAAGPGRPRSRSSATCVNEVFVRRALLQGHRLLFGAPSTGTWAGPTSSPPPATPSTQTRRTRRRRAPWLYGNFANLALGLPEGGSSYFDNGLRPDKFTQEFRLTSQGDGPFEWMVGAFYTRRRPATTPSSSSLNQLDGTPLPAPFDGIAGVLAELELPSRYEETAVFANGAYRFNDWFKLEAGVRYSENDQEFSQNVTERPAPADRRVAWRIEATMSSPGA